MNLGLDPNDLSTQALITTAHELVGGTIAELTGGEFSSGAVATAVGHVVGEFMTSSDSIDGAYASGLSHEEFKQQAIALGKAVGGATVLLTQEGVDAEELDRATSMAASVVENNSLAKPTKAIYDVGKKLYDKFNNTGTKPTGNDIKDALRDELGDIVDNITTLADGQLNMDDAYAIVSLISGFDFKKGDITELNKQIGGKVKKANTQDQLDKMPDGDKYGNEIVREPRTLQDKIAMDALTNNNPNIEVKIFKYEIGNPKFPNHEKVELEVISTNGAKTNVHGMRDVDTGKVTDIKYKDHSDGIFNGDDKRVVSKKWTDRKLKQEIKTLDKVKGRKEIHE